MMKKALNDKEARAIQEEIRTRVFEKYAETQGVQTQEHELQATLEALHEITHIPLSEIEKIASEVTQEYALSKSSRDIPQEQLSRLTPSKDFTFEKLVEKVRKKRRGFIPHLIAYVCVNIPLIYLNFISTSFPWAMFPLLGWGIGLGSHYFAAVRWPATDLRNKIRFLKSQVHQIMDENVPAYQTNAQSKIFNGVYRLLVIESSQETINEYVRNVDPRMSDHEVKQVTTQLWSLRNKYITET
jgi:hypothetical protein